jgi:hypothetical protein
MESGDSGGSGDGAMAGGNPGFGDSIGGDLSLPSLVDEEPVYTASSSSSGSGSGSSKDSSDGDGDGDGDGDDDDDSSSSGSGSSGSNNENSSPGTTNGQVASNAGTDAGQAGGTRAQGGLEPDWGATDTMTTAERVAVLDRQLEESTGVFDAIIREEQRQQRESQREQGASSQSSTQSSDDSGTETSSGGRNPYEADDQGGYGSVGGGMGGRSGGAPDAPAVYEAPEDIPSGNDDDIVARQLREAAMREPDPDIREALWNEYRKYKGIEIPEE